MLSFAADLNLLQSPPMDNVEVCPICMRLMQATLLPLHHGGSQHAQICPRCGYAERGEQASAPLALAWQTGLYLLIRWSDGPNAAQLACIYQQSPSQPGLSALQQQLAHSSELALGPFEPGPQLEASVAALRNTGLLVEIAPRPSSANI